MKEYYPGNTYKTSDKKRSSFWDYFFFRTRIYFYIRLIKSIYSYNSKYAKKGLYTTEEWVEESNEVLRICESSGGKVEISGIDNIREVKDEPVVFVSNHMGLLETLILPSIVEPIKRVTFVVKSSLVEMPLIGNIVGSTNPIIVGRQNPRDDLMKVISEGIENLNKNISILLFPESTRYTDFDRRRFNSLGVKLAVRAKVKIIPFALKTDFIQQGKYVKDLGKLRREKTVYIKFGKAMKIEGNGKKEHNEIIEFISENLRNWGTEVL
jgi:1-acyl-sn-glycerol-3-phosphate acyltransferase